MTNFNIFSYNKVSLFINKLIYNLLKNYYWAKEQNDTEITSYGQKYQDYWNKCSNYTKSSGQYWLVE